MTYYSPVLSLAAPVLCDDNGAGLSHKNRLEYTNAARRLLSLLAFPLISPDERNFWLKTKAKKTP